MAEPHASHGIETSQILRTTTRREQRSESLHCPVMLFLALIPITLELNIQLFETCPTFSSASLPLTVSHCQIITTSSLYILGTGYIIFEDVLFTDCTTVVFMLELTDYILFRSVVFQNFHAKSTMSAIKIDGVTELQLDSVEFKDFSDFILLDSSGLARSSGAIWTCYDVICTNIQTASSQAIFSSATEHVYVNGLTFTSCTTLSLLNVNSVWLSTPPTFSAVGDRLSFFF
jgi:hypothetical protein